MDNSLRDHILKSIDENKKAMENSTNYKEKYEELLARVDEELKNREKAEMKSIKQPSSDVLADLKQEVLSGVNHLASLEDRWSYFDNTMQDCLFRLNKDEQYSKINNLLFKGFPKIPEKIYGRELRKHIVDGLNKILPNLKGGPVQMHEVEYGHNLKTRRPTLKNIVIVKFSCRFTRNEIFYSKKDIPKSSGVTISEHLTKENLDLFHKAKDIVGVRNVWTSQTKIFAKLHADDKNKLAITSWQGIKKLQHLAFPAGNRDTAAQTPHYRRQSYFVDKRGTPEYDSSISPDINNTSPVTSNITSTITNDPLSQGDKPPHTT